MPTPEVESTRLTIIMKKYEFLEQRVNLYLLMILIISVIAIKSVLILNDHHDKSISSNKSKPLDKNNDPDSLPIGNILAFISGLLSSAIVNERNSIKNGLPEDCQKFTDRLDFMKSQNLMIGEFEIVCNITIAEITKNKSTTCQNDISGCNESRNMDLLANYYNNIAPYYVKSIICQKDIFENEEVDGRVFLKMSKQKFRECGIKIGPAIKLADFAKECKEKKLRAFSTYCSLKEVLKITYKLEDEDEELQQCIKEIADSNEAMRCEYISTILHASLYIVKRITEKELVLAPQLEVVGEGSTGQVDYAIKSLEELICIMEGKLHQVVMSFAQNLIQCESALQVNKNNRKRKSGETFGDDYDYIYGIITTATEWYFILFASDGISCTSKNPLNIRLPSLP
ncbi:hypothetical protein C1645_882569 [Glomus cerebriforme]|uniref:SAM domain-containing protein n=1 Tax=Glomus cerebriforme TaxID=658196 RepID=A0A397SBF0_9GLOM|nr:hypothetical protein C1645_882569 [Glomus cerebriforme]